MSPLLSPLFYLNVKIPVPDLTLWESYITLTLNPICVLLVWKKSTLRISAFLKCGEIHSLKVLCYFSQKGDKNAELKWAMWKTWHLDPDYSGQQRWWRVRIHPAVCPHGRAPIWISMSDCVLWWACQAPTCFIWSTWWGVHSADSLQSPESLIPLGPLIHLTLLTSKLATLVSIKSFNLNCFQNQSFSYSMYMKILEAVEQETGDLPLHSLLALPAIFKLR